MHSILLIEGQKHFSAQNDRLEMLFKFRVTFRVTEGTMAIPIQVWTAQFERNMFDEGFALDMHRARQVWRGVDRIWLSFDAQEVVYWSRDLGALRLWECLVYAEAFNV